MQVLTVHQPFGDYAVGDMIRDPAEMQKVKDAGQTVYCTLTNVPDDFWLPAKADAPAPAAPAPQAKS